MPDTAQEAAVRFEALCEKIKRGEWDAITTDHQPMILVEAADFLVLAERAERADAPARLVNEDDEAVVLYEDYNEVAGYWHEAEKRAEAAEARVVELETALRAIKRQRSALFLDGYCEDIIDRAFAAGTERPQEPVVNHPDLNKRYRAGDSSPAERPAVERTQESWAGPDVEAGDFDSLPTPGAAPERTQE